MVNREELNALIGMDEDEMDARAAAYEDDSWDSSHMGKVTMGRPPLYGEPLKSISFREAASKVAAMDKRAASLSMTRSDYIRSLIDRDLAAVS